MAAVRVKSKSREKGRGLIEVGSVQHIDYDF